MTPSPVLEARLAALAAERDPEFDPPPFDAAVAEVLGPAGAPGTPHRRLLERMNGAYLFGRALHLFGACEGPPWHGLRAWNDPAGWRASFGPLADGYVFFAEDAFGDQYAYSRRPGDAAAAVVRFETETGHASTVAPHLEAWLDALLADPAAVLPVDVLAAQAAEGKRLQPGWQLVAWPPLASVEARDGVTVGHADALEAMRFRGQLARQIAALPNGSQIELVIE